MDEPFDRIAAVEKSRVRGVAVGAAVGDALGMPLEFGARIPASRLVRMMQSGRLPAGSFTDDTEMALALADSLLDRFPLDAGNLAQHFVAWFQNRPPDVGIHTSSVLSSMARGDAWQAAVSRTDPKSAGNGSVMRCWPVALAYSRAPTLLVAASELQSRVTHPNAECLAACSFVNVVISLLVQGQAPRAAVDSALATLDLPAGLKQAILSSPGKSRGELRNGGWVRETVESAVWGLLTTGSFEEAVVQVVNLGNDADTAGAVAGALAGAAYGVDAIPAAWRAALQGEWPLHSRKYWDAASFEEVADRLAGLGKRLVTAAP